MFDLTGRVTFVTGGAQGIGRAICLMHHERGAKVVVADKNVNGAGETLRLIEQAGGSGLAVQLDVSSEDAWADAIEAVRQNYGRLDALVNNAGFMKPAPFETVPHDDLRTSLAVNAESVFLGCRAALPLLRQTAESQGVSPAIVNISSVFGMMAGPAHVSYSASKGAIRGMAKGLAVELARHQIRVNTVFPGPANTELLANAVRATAAAGNNSPEERMNVLIKAHPMGRLAEPGDIAAVVTFLCTDASAFMTGAELVVDGGFSLL
ncbi:SDR family NAD(P)-dependent oxidoreductase [Sphingomonas sp. 35-24ZXX]|uniref:SDR family NAD(P)-dependent oxidoreductase n=1 Tax=Sphingomonas sp. 35-24ZXX TaxID=1545915 RepID=UPI00053BDCAF|nr:SDR family oxidoreductase [Sphingomonas sp. 35-24ZXX]